MLTSFKSIRGLVAIGLAVGLVAAACGSSSSTGNPFVPGNPGGTSAAGGGGNSLAAGLSSNLDQLTSYQFTETIAGQSSGSAASPGSSGAFVISGTVVNKPTQAIQINDLGVQFIDIGGQEWTSFDGNTWTGPTAADSSVTDLLPGHDYGTWFDTNATNFTNAGTETKNGVQCIHYKGNSSLGNLYSGITGVSATFQADLWIAVDGNYPVSGVYGFTASSGGQSGAFGFSFDVTHINDAANKVAPPTNTVAVPT
ncbi:MAG: hypothetical protein ACHRXM_40680 [Isosphaerales bacterium]